MAQYIGYNTIGIEDIRKRKIPNDTNISTIISPSNSGKKFKLTDSSLVIRDFLNAMNIRQGEKVGNPNYGSTIWNFVFDPNTSDVQFELENELRRIAKLDPRLILNTIKAYPQENGILIEIELAIAPFNKAEFVSLFLDSKSGKALIQ